VREHLRANLGGYRAQQKQNIKNDIGKEGTRGGRGDLLGRRPGARGNEKRKIYKKKNKKIVNLSTTTGPSLQLGSSLAKPFMALRSVGRVLGSGGKKRGSLGGWEQSAVHGPKIENLNLDIFLT